MTALAVTVMLAALALVFTQSMRTELLASGNRAAAAQADAIVLGAEQWVLAQVEASVPDALAIVDVPAEAVPVGSGYFWLIRPDPDDDTRRDYGIIDEAGKANLNTLAETRLLQLPGMTAEAADAIRDWASSGSSAASASVYASLGYRKSGEAMKTPEELLLVNKVTPQLLWGYDRNRDGVLDDAERSGADFGVAFNAAGDAGRGFLPFATLWGEEPNTQRDGSARVNINSRNMQQLRNGLRNTLRDSLSSTTRADQIYNNLNTAIAVAQRNNAPVWFGTLGDFYIKSTMTPDEFTLVADKITWANTDRFYGLLNVNTAGKQALATLPGLTLADAEMLVAARQSADTSSFAWAIAAMEPSKAISMGSSVTDRSYFYSADIVAVSGDGRAFKRVKIVVDAQTTPGKIVYRKDLTHLGWPLDRSVRDRLRAGDGVLSTGAF